MGRAPLGYACAVGAALLWASCGTAGKFLFHKGMSPLVLVQTRVTLASLVTAAILAVWKPSLLRIRPRDTVTFIILGAVFMALMQLSYFMAISKMQVAPAILIQYLAPVIVACISMIFWKEKVTAKKLVSILLSLAGCYLVVGGWSVDTRGMNGAGLLWALLAAGAYAATTLMGEKAMHRYNPLTTLTYSFLFSALTLNFAISPLEIFSMSLTPLQWAVTGYIVLFGTIAPFGLYLLGINHIRSTRTVITATLEPAAAALIAFLILGETLSAAQLTGGLFVIGAIVLLQLEREHDELSPDTIRARRR